MTAVLATGFTIATIREKAENTNADVLRTFIDTGALEMNNAQKDNFRRGSFSITPPTTSYSFNCDTPVYFTEESADIEQGALRRRVWFNRLNFTPLVTRTASGNNLRSWKATYRNEDQHPPFPCNSLAIQREVAGFEESDLWKINCDWATNAVDQL